MGGGEGWFVCASPSTAHVLTLPYLFFLWQQMHRHIHQLQAHHGPPRPGNPETQQPSQLQTCDSVMMITNAISMGAYITSRKKRRQQLVMQLVNKMLHTFSSRSRFSSCYVCHVWYLCIVHVAGRPSHGICKHSEIVPSAYAAAFSFVCHCPGQHSEHSNTTEAI